MAAHAHDPWSYSTGLAPFAALDSRQAALLPGIKIMASRPGRAWYSNSIEDFLRDPEDLIFGQLAKHSEFEDNTDQKTAWTVEVSLLQKSLIGLSGHIFFEFSIPRMGRRIDVALLFPNVLIVLEFKVGTADFDRSAIDQTWDYALDLKNFHGASHPASIVPILVATEAIETESRGLISGGDGVYEPLRISSSDLRRTLDSVIESIHGEPLDAVIWAESHYHPTPTIVEAARSLYAQHSVEAIARFDAGTQNLRVTSSRVEELADEAKRDSRKIICFVTGVPGAGKTLVGLNVATRRRDPDAPTHAVFLSGNGPLVAVLREALTRDDYFRRKAKGEKVRKLQIGESVKAFIQNVHHFRDDALVDELPPIEHVVIFDEAQRAWNRQQTANFMLRKKGRSGFNVSEAELLISYMDRHLDWALIVCLVGGGQEINIGEAGIDSWLEAVNTRFPHWSTYISDQLHDSEYGAGAALEHLRGRTNSSFDQNLHLAVSMRSFRAENVSAFVKALLDCEKETAQAQLRQLVSRYPIVLTRDLCKAKQWVKSHARGSERFGLVASSKAQRLKPHAIDIRVPVDPVHWFLDDKNDTRSSYYLEDAATEFQVQGLELDWVCVTWDGDLRFKEGSWSFHDFCGHGWRNINKVENREYLRNAYRVLLTRARQGMVVFVPPGDSEDPTRSSSYYDPTFTYLTELGLPVL